MMPPTVGQDAHALMEFFRNLDWAPSRAAEAAAFAVFNILSSPLPHPKGGPLISPDERERIGRLLMLALVITAGPARSDP